MTQPPLAPTLKPNSVATGPKLARRTFLIGGGAGVGLLLGYGAYDRLWPQVPPLRVPAQADETALSGWLKIGADGRIVVFVPQVEMGQGVYTALPQILADELGADWTHVAVEPAPRHPLYSNPGLLQEAIADLSPWFEDKVQALARRMIRDWGVQATVGSTSVQGLYETIRAAGATARALLSMAAARRWAVPWADCVVENSEVEYGDNRASFAELAAAAAREVPPARPPLKSSGQFRLIGRSVPRLDVPGKVRGTALFGADIRVPEMLYAAVNETIVPDKPWTLLDKPTVPALRGVVQIWRSGSFVAVVANNSWRAQQALTALRLPVSAPFPASFAPDQMLQQALKTGEGETLAGEAASAIAEKLGTKPFSARYTLPYMNQFAPEPMTATAWVRPGLVEIWAPVQSISLAATAVARALGVDLASVVVRPTLLGGGYGRKLEVACVVQAALIARHSGKPVQLLWSRTQDSVGDAFQPGAQAVLRARLDANHHITALHMRVASESVSHSFRARVMPDMPQWGADPVAAAGLAALPYGRGRALRVEHVRVATSVPVGFSRGGGHRANAFFWESFMDELAVAARQNPVDFRLAQFADAPRHAAMLKLAAQKAGYAAPWRVGHGLGVAVWQSFGTVVAIVLEVAPIATGGALVPVRVVAAVDPGMLINPKIARAVVEGGLLQGLSDALYGGVSFKEGRFFPVDLTADTHLTLNTTPVVEVHLAPSGAPIGGLSEGAGPLMAPALANAIFAASGVRARALPLAKALRKETL